jgi:hypothetical protein
MPQTVGGVYYREEISVESDSIADAAAAKATGTAATGSADLAPAAAAADLFQGNKQALLPLAASGEQGQQPWLQQFSFNVWTPRQQQTSDQPPGSEPAAADILQAAVDKSSAGQSAPFLHQLLHVPPGHPAQCISDVLPPPRQQQHCQGQHGQQQQDQQQGSTDRAGKRPPSPLTCEPPSPVASRSVSADSSSRTINSSSSSNTPAFRSASAAAIAAVMSLKASLAKQAMAVSNPPAVPALNSPQYGHNSAPLPEVIPQQQQQQRATSAAAIAASGAGTVWPRSQPLPELYNHAGQAASALSTWPRGKQSLETPTAGQEAAVSSWQQTTQPGRQRCSLDAHRTAGPSAAAVAANGMRQIWQRRSDRALLEAWPAGQQLLLDQRYQQPPVDRVRLSMDAYHTRALEQQQQQQRRPAQPVGFTGELRYDVICMI